MSQSCTCVRDGRGGKRRTKEKGWRRREAYGYNASVKTSKLISRRRRVRNFREISRRRRRGFKEVVCRARYMHRVIQLKCDAARRRHNFGDGGRSAFEYTKRVRFPTGGKVHFCRPVTWEIGAVNSEILRSPFALHTKATKERKRERTKRGWVLKLNVIIWDLVWWRLI